MLPFLANRFCRGVFGLILVVALTLGYVASATPIEWQDGDVITWSQNSWGYTPTSTNAAGLLLANFDTIYPFFGFFEVGTAGAAGFSMQFFNAPSLHTYLPATGVPGALNADLFNPTSSSSGVFGGQVAALQLNVDFNDANILVGAAATRFGDLLLSGFTSLPFTSLPPPNGMSVRQYLAAVNTALGGGTALYPIVTLSSLTFDLDLAFQGGTPTTFAQDHLILPTSSVPARDMAAPWERPRGVGGIQGACKAATGVIGDRKGDRYFSGAVAF